MDCKLPVVGFAAFSGTGKTTLLKKLISRLNQESLKIAVIKHAHHNFEIDLPGKDSYELRMAGAQQMLISSKRRFVQIAEQERSLVECIASVDQDNCDLIFVEGYKRAEITKIELYRPELGFPMLNRMDKNIIAIATDGELDESIDIPVLDLNNSDEIAKFIVNNLDRFNCLPS